MSFIMSFFIQKANNIICKDIKQSKAANRDTGETNTGKRKFSVDRLIVSALYFKII